MRRLVMTPSALILAALSLFGCSSPAPMPPVSHVDVNRFMGAWYVIASIPSRFEGDAYNAVETYELRADGKIQTTFRYRKGGFDGTVKTMHPVGTVQADSGNAIWGMQFIWPIQAEYVIAYLDPDYREVIIGRSKRDYVWIMARTPAMDAQDYEKMVAEVAALGYSTDKLRKVPQKWPEPSGG
jgi:apolipoprotein D and lipocalin family protein